MKSTNVFNSLLTARFFREMDIRVVYWVRGLPGPLVIMPIKRSFCHCNAGDGVFQAEAS